MNTRLNMLREVLRVMQTKMENKNKSKLEWVVIYLIVFDITVKALGGVFMLLGLLAP